MRKIYPDEENPPPAAAAGQLCNFLNLVATSPHPSPPTPIFRPPLPPPLIFSASPLPPSRSLVPSLLRDSDCKRGSKTIHREQQSKMKQHRCFSGRSILVQLRKRRETVVIAVCCLLSREIRRKTHQLSASTLSSTRSISVSDLQRKFSVCSPKRFSQQSKCLTKAV